MDSELPTGQAVQVAQSLIERGGPLGVLVVCVGMFLLYMWRRGQQDQETEKLRQQSLERMETTCHEAQAAMLERVDQITSRTVEALDRNTEAFGRSSAVVERALDLLDNDLRASRAA